MCRRRRGADVARVRLLRLGLLVSLCVLVVAPPALAARRVPASLVLRAESANFAIWSEPSGDQVPSDATVAQLVAAAEDVRARELALGFPAPRDDGDGRTDVYLTALADDHPALTFPEPGAATTSAYIVLDPVRTRLAPWILAHEYFHVIQLGLAASLPSWVAEGSAVWMQDALGLTPPAANAILGTSLDCGRDCSQDATDVGALSYSRSVFFDYLAARFTPVVVRDTLEALRAAGTAARPGLAAVAAALRGRGSSLPAAYAAFAVAAAPTARPDVTFALTATHMTETLPIAVPSYATRILQVAAPCGNATVTVAVVGAGALAPKLLVGGAVKDLGRNPSGWSLSVPWSPCAAGAARLVVPNVGDAPATLTAQLSVGGPSVAPATKSTASRHGKRRPAPTGHKTGIKKHYGTGSAIVTRANVNSPSIKKYLYTP
jgi:hypothetical protein